MTKKHVWRIKKEYFRQLNTGEKSLEVRVGYAAVKKVHEGDTITFENYGPNLFEVLRVQRYDSFKELLAREGVEQVLPGMTEDGALRILHGIYPVDREALGVYAFELKPIDEKPKLKKYIASELLKADENKMFSKLVYDSYCATDWISEDYPEHCDHFYTKYVPGIFDGTREIITMYYGDDFAGMIVLKKDLATKDGDDPAAAKPEMERKICTLYVSPRYQNKGIATQLIEASFDWLGTDKPLASIADYKISQFKRLIEKYGWKQTQVLDVGYYNDKYSEIVFNGQI